MKSLLSRLIFVGLVIQNVVSFSTVQRPRKVASEQLVPLHSTTALMCEPIFHGSSSSATWYREGKKVATVTSSSNAFYEQRNYTSDEKMPDVGFLIISDIQKADEGEFWCRKEGSQEAGEVSYLRVAYVDQLQAEGQIQMNHEPSLGESLVMHCNVPKAYPKPTVTWLLEKEPLSAVSADFKSFSNGTLIIHRFSPLHVGTYECVVSNFAGRTSTSLFVGKVNGAGNTKIEQSRKFGLTNCINVFRSSILWFLIGCLATSSLVLIYLLCALMMLRRTSRSTFRPSMWLRSNHLLGPGFRKAVVPTPDYLVPQQTNN